MLAVTAPHLLIPRVYHPEDPLQSRVAADKAPGVCGAAAEAMGVLASEQHCCARASGTGSRQGEGHAQHQDGSRAHWESADKAAEALLLLLNARVEFFRGGSLRKPGLWVRCAKVSNICFHGFDTWKRVPLSLLLKTRPFHSVSVNRAQCARADMATQRDLSLRKLSAYSEVR